MIQSNHLRMIQGVLYTCMLFLVSLHLTLIICCVTTHISYLHYSLWSDLIKWLGPKGVKVCSYIEKCAEFKYQTLKKMVGTQKCYAQLNTPGVGNFSK